jgi:hypothetical protein
MESLLRACHLLCGVTVVEMLEPVGNCCGPTCMVGGLGAVTPCILDGYEGCNVVLVVTRYLNDAPCTVTIFNSE